MNQEEARNYHNVIAPVIVKLLCKPSVENPDGVDDVLVLLESAIAGVMLFITMPGHDDDVIKRIMEGVKIRLAELREKHL